MIVNSLSNYSYYPYGMLMPRRYWPGNDVSNGSYRFGFNGKEKDDEMKGSAGNSYDFGARIYDPRIGGFLSIDPYSKKFAGESNYSYAGNNPIYFIERDGKFRVAGENIAQYKKDYPLIMKYLETMVEQDIIKSAKIVQGLMQTNPNIKEEVVKDFAKWNRGPEIVFTDAPGEFPSASASAAGWTDPQTHQIQLNSKYANYVENLLKSGASEGDKMVGFMRFYMTLTHELAHDINKFGPYMGKDASGKPMYQAAPNGANSSDEVGNSMENYVWGTDIYKPGFVEFDAKGVKGINSLKYKPGMVEDVIEKASSSPEGQSTLPTLPPK